MVTLQKNGGVVLWLFGPVAGWRGARWPSVGVALVRRGGEGVAGEVSEKGVGDVAHFTEAGAGQGGAVTGGVEDFTWVGVHGIGLSWGEISAMAGPDRSKPRPARPHPAAARWAATRQRPEQNRASTTRLPC